LFEH